MLLNMLKAINSVIIIGGARVKVQTMMSPSMVASLGRLAGHNCKLVMLHNIMVPIIFNHCAIRVV